MALEAVVFPQDLFSHVSKDLYSMVGVPWSYGFGGLEEEEKGKVEMSREKMPSMVEWDANSSSPETFTGEDPFTGGFPAEAAAAGGQRKRRRMKSCKNREEVENQRMTHIAVERNRRKQMNEYLAALRSLMPPSYVQRGDQASIIGGAINFVKELEQLLQSLKAQKGSFSSAAPFSDFFTFPQYSTIATTTTTTSSSSSSTTTTTTTTSSMADIEVSMVESYASLKILCRRQPKQLLKLVVGLQGLRLTALHLNVTTVEDMVLYSFSLKVEDDCQLSSVDEIATAVYQMLGKMQEEK